MASFLQFLFIIVNVGFSLIYCSKISFCDDKENDEVYLDLTNVGIETLRKSFVSSASITCLKLAENRISSLDPEAFEGLPELECLDLSQNRINFKEFCHLNKFKELKTLLFDNAMEPPPPERTHHQRYVQYDDYGRRVTMRPYRLDEDETISIFQKLEKLSLSNYQTTDILDALATFGDMPNLTELRLAGNQLVTDADLHLIGYPNLTHLYLDGNEVSVFSGMTLPDLRHLSLDNNKIQKLCSIYCNENSMTPRAIQSLEYLSIAGNSMVAIDADAFANSANLLYLDLSNNKIENVPRHTFDNLTRLRNLTLNDNSFDRVPDICALEDLRALSLNGNRITSIDQASFCNLTKLAYVSLQNNGLTLVASETFGHLPVLARVDLSSNDLEWLPDNWIRSGIKLDELILDGNKFTNLENMSLGYFEGLGYLSIGRNSLRTITIGSLIQLPINTTVDVARAC